MLTAFGLAAVAVGTGNALSEMFAGTVAAESEAILEGHSTDVSGRGLEGIGIATGVGDTASRMRASRLTLFEAARRLDEAAALGRPVPGTVLADAKLMLSRAIRDVADAAHGINMLAGARACLEGNPVGRLWRDTHMACRHAALAPVPGFDIGGRSMVRPEHSDAEAIIAPLAPDSRR